LFVFWSFILAKFEYVGECFVWTETFRDVGCGVMVCYKMTCQAGRLGETDDKARTHFGALVQVIKNKNKKAQRKEEMINLKKIKSKVK
jgi:hypothetical protein